MPIHATTRLKSHSTVWRGCLESDGYGDIVDEQTQSPKRNFHKFIELRECEK